MKSKKILKFALLIALLVSLLSGVCFATEAEGDTVQENSTEATTDEEVVVYNDGSEEAETVEEKWTEDDIYLFNPNENIIIDDNVSGNLFLIGKDVTINSDVIYGSIYVFATESIKITEGCQITGSIYICSPKAYLEVITSDIYAIANDFTLVENYGVYRDFKLLADTAQIDGAVTRNAYIVAQKSLNFGENSLVFGNLEYSVPAEVTLPELLKDNCGGEIKYTPLKNTNEITTDDIGTYVYDLASNFVVIVAVFVICAILNLKVVHQYENKNILKQILKHLFVGIIAFLSIVVVMTLLLISAVGISLAGILATVFILTFVLYFAILVISVANALSQKLNKILSLIISTIVLWVLMNIPVAGTIIGLVMYFISLGIITCHLMDMAKSNKKPENENKEETENSKTEEIKNEKQEIVEEPQKEDVAENEENNEVKDENAEGEKEEKVEDVKEETTETEKSEEKSDNNENKE